MAFSDAVLGTIAALLDGRFEHEPRPLASGKNLLASGQISPQEVVALLRRCRAHQHEVRPHHHVAEQAIDIFKPVVDGERWYIKSYLIEADGEIAVFISVHLQGAGGSGGEDG